MDTESKNMYIHTRIHVYAGGHTYIYIYIYPAISSPLSPPTNIILCEMYTQNQQNSYMVYMHGVCMWYICIYGYATDGYITRIQFICCKTNANPVLNARGQYAHIWNGLFF